MKLLHIALAFAIAPLTGCFIFGQDDVDPAAAAPGDRVTSLWMSTQTITATVVDGDRVFAVTERYGNQGSSSAGVDRDLWEIGPGGKSVTSHWQEKAAAMPSARLAADATALYMVRSVYSDLGAGPCEVDRLDKSALDAPPVPLALITPTTGSGSGADDCTPVGIAVDGGNVFVAVHSRNGPAYRFTVGDMSYGPGMQTDVNGSVWSVPVSGGAASLVASGRVFAAFAMPNVLVVHQGQLYWAEGTIVQGSGSQGPRWTSSTIATSAEAPGSTPTTFAGVAAGRLPTGLAASSAGVYWSAAEGSPTENNGMDLALKGCWINVPGDSTSFLYTDSFACTDLVAVADRVYFPLAPPQSTTNSYERPRATSIAAVTAAGARSGPLALQVDVLDLRRLQVQGTSLLAIDANVILSVPMSLLP